jgi:aspartyl-tRNA(Asn)/glutamyl-tRNA(Gln) amidotransferase subunit B
LIHKNELKSNDAEILIQQGKSVVEYFLHCIRAGANAKRVAVWMLQDVLRTLNDRSIGIELYPVSPTRMAELLTAIEQGKVDTSQAKQALAKLIDEPNLSVDAAIESLGIVRVDASEIESLCKELLAENADVIDKVRAGNTKAVAALVGQAKKRNRNADPRLVQETCLKLIEQMQ